MKDHLTSHFALGKDIDASVTRDWNENAENGEQKFGFEPIGILANKFTGSFDGRRYTISNPYINRPTTEYVGLFSYTESGDVVENVGLENENVTGSQYVGGLVGLNGGEFWLFSWAVSNAGGGRDGQCGISHSGNR